MTTYLVPDDSELRRYIFVGACNEPQPSNWKNACRRRAGHPGEHQTWDPCTGTDRGRHPLPAYHADGRRGQLVTAWGGRLRGFIREVWMLSASAYVAPKTTDAEMFAAIAARHSELIRRGHMRDARFIEATP